jgi:hypothetical protein
LNNLLDRGQRGEWRDDEHPEGAIEDGFKPPTANGEKRLEPDVCGAFFEALKRAVSVAVPRPLVLVFDKLGGPAGERLLDPREFEQLIRHLFRPIAQDPGSMIKLVFSVNTAEHADYKLSLLPPAQASTYDLAHEYTEQELIEFATEMLWFNEEDKVRKVAEALFGYVDEDADAPKGLARLSLVLEPLRLRRNLISRIERMR